MSLDKIILTNFTELSQEDQDMVLTWRNHKEIRSWMYNSEIISKEKHFNFIEHLKVEKTKLYFLVFNHKEAIGVVSLINISKDKAELGIYAKPQLKAQGKILLKSLINYSFSSLKLKALTAEVFEENLPAISLYKKLNFKIYNKKIIQDRKILLMELKNENR